MGGHSKIDPLTATCVELQKLLGTGEVKSTDLVHLYLDQIEKFNHQGLNLNAMISTIPRFIAIAIAEDLDRERAAGKVRGPLHGIPVSDNICTDPALGMYTTCGTFTLMEATPKGNAPIVDQLIKAGMIIIGKANLSGLASRLGGQHLVVRRSPHRLSVDWSGEKSSSDNRAAGLAAGFAPVALATETDGSITQPANRAAIYGLKLTVGTLSTEGTATWSHLTDSVGGMAKSAEELALLMDVLVEGKNYARDVVKSWEGMRIDWAMVHEDVPFASMDDLNYNGEDALEQLWNHDFAADWAEYLKSFDNALIRSIADMQLLELSLEDKMTGTEYKEASELIRLAAKTNGVGKTIADFDLDVIIGPMDGRIPTIAAAAGCPVGTIPLGYSPSNGRPYGLAVVAAAEKEDHIIKFMSAWDATMPRRKPPPQMVHWDETLSSQV
ncbi:amidase signature enzyme [Cadophora sp. DSE1049]|nr:amidase signature enzyme [Cadophora sp. DSE1049]